MRRLWPRDPADADVGRPRRRRRRSLSGMRRRRFLYPQGLQPEAWTDDCRDRGGDQRGLLLVQARPDRVLDSGGGYADRSRDLRTPEGSHGLLPLPLRVPRRLQANRRGLRPTYGRCARTGVREADWQALSSKERHLDRLALFDHALIRRNLNVAV